MKINRGSLRSTCDNESKIDSTVPPVKGKRRKNRSIEGRRFKKDYLEVNGNNHQNSLLPRVCPLPFYTQFQASGEQGIKSIKHLANGQNFPSLSNRKHP